MTDDVTEVIAGRRHVSEMEQELIAGTNAQGDETGRHDFTLYEFPCPGCDRMLWGWTKGHVETPPEAMYHCPCGAHGVIRAGEHQNIRHRSIESYPAAVPKKAASRCRHRWTSKPKPKK